MNFLNRDDNSLTLTNDNSGKMSFVYKSGKHAVIFGVFAIAMSFVAWYFSDEIKNVHAYIYWFTCFLAGGLCFGTIMTLMTNCKLDIDTSRKKIIYTLSTIFRKTHWEKNFNELKEIRIYHPLSGSGSAGHASLFKVLIKTKKDEEIPLGLGTLGTRDKNKAKELAEKLSKIMSLNVIQK